MNAQASLDDYLSALLDDPPAVVATVATAVCSAPSASTPMAETLAPRPMPCAVASVSSSIEPVAPASQSQASEPPSPPALQAVPAAVSAPAPAPAALPKPIFELPRATPHSPSQAASIALLQSLAQRNDPAVPRRRASERTTRWLRMRCDHQQYALELLKIQEVVLPSALLPLRGSLPHMLGVMNLRGQIVPVIDLGLFLQRDAIIVDSATRIVVVEENGEVLGLRVSAVEDVANLTEQQIESPETTRVCRITSQLFRGVARIGDRTLILLDASSLLE